MTRGAARAEVVGGTPEGDAHGAATSARAASPPRVAARAGAGARAGAPAGALAAVAAGPASAEAETQRSLAYTFDTFVVGPCNALAREASYELARGRQLGVSPLFLVSEPGLGKTHLARAVSAEARRQGLTRILSVSSEGFTSEFLSSIRGQRMGGFKRRFREQCDLFVLEDVQFLGGKKSTQGELFHTIEHLLGTRARVLLTADRLPRDIPDLDPRLCSQMSGGLVAELEAPDARVRRQILRAKAAAGGVRLPEDCLDRLVAGARGSVRDLEGVLIQLVATSALLKRPIDLELTDAALRKLATVGPDDGRALAPETVIGVVASYFKTTPEALAARSRRRDVVVPRQLAMYLARRYTHASLQRIGEALGRDHPAVSHALGVVERQILERAPLRYQIEAIAARLDAVAGRGRSAPG
jgi:chromosomal replication initiator protein